MRNKNPNAAFRGISLDTLAQNGTGKNEKPAVILDTLAQNGTGKNEKPAVILVGKGSDITAKGYGERRGKTKIITQALLLKMIDIAKQEKRYDIEKSLWNSYHCQNIVYTHEGRLYGKYCKNRFCTACQGIRKAILIKAYSPILQEWENPYFVTLTIKSVPKYRLREMFEKCLEGLNRIVDKYEKRASRAKGNKIVAIRSLECNFNPQKRSYNPHFHLIVPDRETADILKNEWLRLWALKPTKRLWVKAKAQDIREVNNLDGALVEVIKYGTKVFTEPTGKKRGVKDNVRLYARAFYNIILAMRGLRLFGSIGFSLDKDIKEDSQSAAVTTDYREWHYLPKYHDWQDSESELTLFGYLPDEVLKELLSDIDSFLD